MSDKAEESAVGPENQMKRRGEPMSPPPPKRMLSMVPPSVEQEGEGAAQPRGSAVSLEDGDPKVTAMPVSREVPDQPPIPMEISAEMKHQLRKEIRLYGQKYERVFKLLEGVQGPQELQEKFCFVVHQGSSKVPGDFCSQQSLRFKRQDLIRHLLKALEELEPDHLLKKDNHI